MSDGAEFDRHADSYDEDLNQALAATGEQKQYFAIRRVEFVAKELSRLCERPNTAIDYGCGTGDSTELLLQRLGLTAAIGLDVSQKSLQRAKASHGITGFEFLSPADYAPSATVDLVYCNGVFHHIPLASRGEVLAYIHRCLRPQGIFSLWENNPINPGTRYVMSRCCFDRDAIPLKPSEAKKLVRQQGFQILSVKFLFFFPRMLRLFRPAERFLARFPLGAQYQILCRKG